MSKMNVTTLRRTKVGENTFQMVAVKAANGEEVTLKTLIVKVPTESAFRKIGSKTIPVEQYGFEVGGKTVDRFDAAAALVIKRHNVAIAEGADVPAYIRRAVDLATA